MSSSIDAENNNNIIVGNLEMSIDRIGYNGKNVNKFPKNNTQIDKK